MQKLQQTYTQRRRSLDIPDAGSESCTSSSSVSGNGDTFSDNSDLASWEEHVNNDGTLFYAEYMLQNKKSSIYLNEKQRIDFSKNATSLRVTKNTNSMRRQQQYHRQYQQQQKQQESNPSKFTKINTTDQSYCKELDLIITATDRYRYGRRSTAVESILGFRVVPFVDQLDCLMFDGFVNETKDNQQIRSGDWFRSLNDIEVRASNIDDLLMQFSDPTKVCLKFQPYLVDNTEIQFKEMLVWQKIENFVKFSEKFQSLTTCNNSETEKLEQTSTILLPFALLILPPECYQQDKHKDSLYFYPENISTNFLYKTRGSFLTLNVVLTKELKTNPIASKLLVQNIPYYVCYRHLNGFLVIFAYAAEYQSLIEANLYSDELIGYMRFAFPTLSLEKFANTNKSAIELKCFLHHFCEIQRVRLLIAYKHGFGQFEELMKESRYMPMPKEAQLRIFDALSEMEAMDYRNWNDEPLNTHREFFIYGSVLYYDNFILASQLPIEIRCNVEFFLRCRGIFDFIATQNVKELYIWEEIALPNATGRYFLTICTRNHLILAVILKIFDSSDLRADAVIPPSLFYIEEIQETLDHLIQCGIESLAMFWSISNKRPEVIDKFEYYTETEFVGSSAAGGKLESFIKQKLMTTTSTSSAMGTLPRSHQSYDDGETQLSSSLGGSSIHSFTPSEDDSNKKRLPFNHHDGDDSDSGSDWENFANQKPSHASYDADAQSQMTESLWKEINNVVPVKISPGWKNSIYYFVYIDNTNGTVFCPLKNNSDKFIYLKEMRRAFHIIHNILERSKTFRRSMTSETHKPANNRNTLAIKEHGMTIQLSDIDESGKTKYVIKGRFTIVGRLFLSPTREVYVCHHPDVPQNMVELAFRLSFFSIG